MNRLLDYLRNFAQPYTPTPADSDLAPAQTGSGDATINPAVVIHSPTTNPLPAPPVQQPPATNQSYGMPQLRARTETRPAWMDDSDLESESGDDTDLDPTTITIQWEKHSNRQITDLQLPFRSQSSGNNTYRIDLSAYDDPIALLGLMQTALSVPDLSALSLRSVMPAQFRHLLPVLLNTRLTYLEIEFAYAHIKKNDAKQLELDLNELIAHHPSLTSLCVDANNLNRHLSYQHGSQSGSLSMNALLRSVVVRRQLQSCSLLGFHLRQLDEALIPWKLDKTHPLKELTLLHKASNGQPKVDALVEGLHCLHSLVVLKSGAYDGGGYDPDDIAELLSDHPALNTLCTSIRVMGPAEVDELCPSRQLPQELTAHLSLTSLDMFMSDSNFLSKDKEHFQALMKALVNRPMLKNLSIHCINAKAEYGARAGYDDDFIEPWFTLIDGLNDSTTLEGLTLTGLPNQLLSAVETMLYKNKHLQSCHLDFIEQLPPAQDLALKALIQKVTTTNRLMPAVSDVGYAMSYATALASMESTMSSTQRIPVLPTDITNQIATAAFQILDPSDAQQVHDAFRVD